MEHTDSSSNQLDHADAQLYDRQIRLLGADKQQLLLAAKVLVIGYTHSTAECIKDLLLGGVRYLHVMDSSVIEEGEKDVLINLGGAANAHVGQSKIEAMLKAAQRFNTVAKIFTSTEQEEIESMLDKIEFLENFHVVVISLQASRLSSKRIFKLIDACRDKKVAVLFGDMVGKFAFYLLDFGEKLLVSIKGGDEGRKTENVEVSCPPMSDVINYISSNDEYISFRRKTKKPRTKRHQNELSSDEANAYRYALLRVWLRNFMKNGTFDTNDESIKIDLKSSVNSILPNLVDQTEDSISKVYKAGVVQNVKQEFWSSVVFGASMAEDVLTIVMRDALPPKNIFFFDASDELLASSESCGSQILVSPDEHSVQQSLKRKFECIECSDDEDII